MFCFQILKTDGGRTFLRFTRVQHRSSDRSSLPLLVFQYSYKMYNPPLTDSTRYMAEWGYRRDLIRDQLAAMGGLFVIVAVLSSLTPISYLPLGRCRRSVSARSIPSLL